MCLFFLFASFAGLLKHFQEICINFSPEEGLVPVLLWLLLWIQIGELALVDFSRVENMFWTVFGKKIRVQKISEFIWFPKKKLGESVLLTSALLRYKCFSVKLSCSALSRWTVWKIQRASHGLSENATQVHFGCLALSQWRIFSNTPRHKWTRLINFLSSLIALIAVNMADKSIWLCLRWESALGDQQWMGVPQ